MSNMRWATGQELLDIMSEQTSLVQNFTIEEAADALGFTKTNNGIYVKCAVITTAGALAYGINATEAASAITASSATGTSIVANLTLYANEVGTAMVGGLGSVALPIAAAMGAAAGGYFIGQEINEHYGDDISKLLFPLFDFVTGNHVADTLYEDDEVDALPYVPSVPMLITAERKTFFESTFNSTVKTFIDTHLKKPLYKLAVPSSVGINSEVYKVGMDYLVQNTLYSYRTEHVITSCIARNLTKDADVFYTVCDFHFPQTLPNYEKVNTILVFLSETPFSFSLVLHNYPTTPTTYVAGAVTINDTTFYRYQIPILDRGYYKDGYVGANNYNYKPCAHSVKLPSASFVSFTDTQLYNLLYGDNVVVSPGFLPTIERYVPGTIYKPIEVPGSKTGWSPVIPSAIAGGVYADPSKLLDTYAVTDAAGLTPYIPAVQRQPSAIPLEYPEDKAIPYVPSIPIVTPFPDISVKPYPSPSATIDPSLPVVIPKVPAITIPKVEPKDVGETPKPTLPVVPNISSAATGLIHVYNPTNEQINQFGTWLWTTFSGDLLDTVSKMFNNPMDAVIGLHEIYSTPIVGSSTTIRAGFLDSGVASQLVSQRYTEIKCGAVGVPEYWSNYLDYAPYTKVFCYLPFIGIIELNADDIIGSGVEITYKIDTYNGSCIALITTAKPNSAESVTYEFSGNCSVEIPITSGMKSSVQAALLGAAVATASAATAGALGAALQGAGAVGSARSLASSKNMVQHSGSFGSSYGAMGIKVPYLIIKRPKQKVVPGYNDNYGYPAHKMVAISACSGYLRAMEVDVISATATEDEKKLIEKQIKSGIFVNESTSAALPELPPLLPELPPLLPL